MGKGEGEVFLEPAEKGAKFYEIRRMENIHNYNSLIVFSTLSNVREYMEKLAIQHYPGKKFHWRESDEQNYQEERNNGENMSALITFRYNQLATRKLDGILKKKSLEKAVEEH